MGIQKYKYKNNNNNNNNNGVWKRIIIINYYYYYFLDTKCKAFMLFRLVVLPCFLFT